jgi:hypothetical protein
MRASSVAQSAMKGERIAMRNADTGSRCRNGDGAHVHQRINYHKSPRAMTEPKSRPMRDNRLQRRQVQIIEITVTAEQSIGIFKCNFGQHPFNEWLECLAIFVLYDLVKLVHTLWSKNFQCNLNQSNCAQNREPQDHSHPKHRQI